MCGVTDRVLYNFSSANLSKWNAALAAVRANAGRAKIACIGDSTTLGYGSNGVTYVGARAASYPSELAFFLDIFYAPARADSFFGNANSGNNATDYPAYDPRVSLGTGWGIFNGVPNYSLGGKLFDSFTATTPLIFSPGVACDTFDVYYLENSSFSVNVNGGSALASVSGLSTNAMRKLTVSAALGMNSLQIVPNGSCPPTYIVGVSGYNSAVDKIAVMNMGIGGAKASDWSDVTYPWSTLNALPVLAPDLSLITLGINDWNGATTPQAYLAAIQSVLDVALVSGSAILIVPVPSSNAVASFARQTTFKDVLYALSDKKRVPLIDLSELRGDYATANADGFYVDVDHPSAAGYFDIAKCIATAIAA